MCCGVDTKSVAVEAIAGELQPACYNAINSSP